MIDLRVEVVPRWAFRLPGMGGRDGVLRLRDGVLQRALRVADELVDVRVAQPGGGPVLFGARAAGRDAAQEAIARMRFALGVDDDLGPFHDRFRDDRLIGRLVRARPWLRVRRRPVAFEALAWAVTEQLIDSRSAAEIQRRMVRSLGEPAPHGLRLPPSPATLVRAGTARLEACGLSPGRARALVRAAREVESGRLDLEAPDHERGWRRLRAIPGIGAWTVEMLALHGQGRMDQVPAGDLNFLKAVGRLRTGSPHARAEEDEVRELFALYAPWAGLAGTYLMSIAPHRLPLPAPARRPARRPVRAGTRWSASAPRRAAA